VTKRCIWPVLVLTSFVGIAGAQVVASRDYSSGRLPTARIPENVEKDLSRETATCFHPHSDGVVVSKIPEKLKLDLVELQPRRVLGLVSMIVTIRLTNWGNEAVKLPWNDKPIERTSGDGLREYDAVTISLALGVAPHRERRTQLADQIELVADMKESRHFVVLSPHQSIELKFLASARCAPSSRCGLFNSDDQAEITANWHESMYTYQGRGCGLSTGFASWRDLTSQAETISYIAPVANIR
jgi:hypothetical protein